MKKLCFVLLCLIIFLPHTLSGQEADTLEYENFWANGKEVGINVTNLAARFVPFNLTNNSDINQFIALKTKWYGSGRTAFIINFGIDINENNDFNKIFFSLGYEKRRHISNKWKYVTGWEAVLTNLGVSSEDAPFVGLSKPFGIEYHFYDNFYISTEARLSFAISDDIHINLSYPTSIFFNMLIE